MEVASFPNHTGHPTNGKVTSPRSLQRNLQKALCSKATSIQALQMPSLGASQPDAAAMFQEAFDEAVDVDAGRELENIWRLLEPKLDVRGIPLRFLNWAFKIAHGISLRSFDTQLNSDEEEIDEIEPPPHEVITDYLKLQMMYVSGETGEPSVETTGIIEDIVRQQVIEIVSIHSMKCPAHSC
jgi:hypothetical protein